MGEIALRKLKTYAPNFIALANTLQLEGFLHLPHLEKDIVTLTKKLDAMSETGKKNRAGIVILFC